MDVRASREAARVRLVDLISLLDLEGEVLYPNLVVAESATVGRPDSEHRACARVPQIHDFLGPAVGRVLIARKPSKRAEEIQIEGQGPLDVTDGEINVVYASCGNGVPPVRVRGDPSAAGARSSALASRAKQLRRDDRGYEGRAGLSRALSGGSPGSERAEFGDNLLPHDPDLFSQIG